MFLMNCPQCGKRVSSEAKFCPDCGFDLQSYMDIKSSRPGFFSKSCVRTLVAIVLFLAVSSFVFVFIAGRSTIYENTSHDITQSESFGLSSSSETSSALSVNASDFNDDFTYKNSDFVGVYTGDDHNMLVLRSNGLANYYCSAVGYTDINCEWNLDGNELSIRLDKLHCIVTANIEEGGDIDRLTFISDSQNWQTEVFDKTDVDPEEYIKRKILSYDSNVEVQADGSLLCDVGGIHFSVPKYYCDIEDEMDDRNDTTLLVNINVDNDYVSSLIFHEKTSLSLLSLNLKRARSLAESFSAGFNDDCSITSETETTVAGMAAYLFGYEGYYNENFYSHTGYKINGYIAVIHNKSAKSIVYAMLEQHSGRSMDERETFLNLLNAAAVK